MCILQAEHHSVCTLVLLRTLKCCVDFAQCEAFCSVGLCYVTAFGDLYWILFFFFKGDLLFSKQTQFNRSSQKLLYEQFKRLTTDWRDLRQRIGRVKTGTSEMSPGFLENQLAPQAESLFLLNCVVEKAYFQGLFKMKTKAKCCYFILRHKILNHILTSIRWFVFPVFVSFILFSFTPVFLPLKRFCLSCK